MSPSRPLTPLALLLCLWPPALARGQTADHDDVETIVNPSPPKSAWEGGADLAKTAEQIIDRANAFRREQGRPEVRGNAKLMRTAADFAAYLARTDRFGHTADGSRPADRAAKHGYEYCIVAENIAYEYSSAGFAAADLARAFLEGWKNSPGHRRNLLDPDVTETGAAVAQSTKTGYFYAVQLFGRPASDRIEFRFANAADAPVTYTIGDRTFTLPPGVARTHQRCRPTEVTFRWGEDKEDRQTVRPENGERYAVEKGKSGRLRVVKQ